MIIKVIVSKWLKKTSYNISTIILSSSKRHITRSKIKKSSIVSSIRRKSCSDEKWKTKGSSLIKKLKTISNLNLMSKRSMITTRSIDRLSFWNTSWQTSKVTRSNLVNRRWRSNRVRRKWASSKVKRGWVHFKIKKITISYYWSMIPKTNWFIMKLDCRNKSFYSISKNRRICRAINKNRGRLKTEKEFYQVLWKGRSTIMCWLSNNFKRTRRNRWTDGKDMINYRVTLRE